VAVTAEPGKQLTIYLDGKVAGTAAMGASIPSPAVELAFGAGLDGKNSFVGDMDEVQLASLVRSAGWLSATFNSQGRTGINHKTLFVTANTKGTQRYDLHFVVEVEKKTS